MKIIISPAKSLDFENSAPTDTFSKPTFLSESRCLVEIMQAYSPQEISALMKISDKLGQLNFSRFQGWRTTFSSTNGKQAMYAFKGDVYTGLDAETLTKTQIGVAQEHLLILSGLYGLLKPLDLIQAYRLEMGTKLENERGKDLYHFWGDRVTKAINNELDKEKKPILVNLASQEYFKSVQKNKINAEIITPVFKDKKSGKYKIISFFAKKARGLMARHLIIKKAKNIEHIKSFNTAGYAYSEEHSQGNEWVFIRDEPH